MIKRKILVFYRVALSSVEVALKLRAAGAIPPFFSPKQYVIDYLLSDHFMKYRFKLKHKI